MYRAILYVYLMIKTCVITIMFLSKLTIRERLINYFFSEKSYILLLYYDSYTCSYFYLKKWKINHKTNILR